MKEATKSLSKHAITKIILGRFAFITLGAFIAGFALEGFLIPNNIIDGGIIGISMMTSYVTKFNLGLLVFLINLPFIFLALQKMGKIFVLQTAYAVTMLSLSVNLFHKVQATEAPLLATVFGGIILGTGVGLVLRNNAALDGTEILSIRLSKKIGLSVGELIMCFNVFIYTCAGFIYGWDNAMYSIITYFIAYRVIDVVLEGLNSSRSAFIISDNAKEIGTAIIKELDVTVTYFRTKGGYSGQEKILVYCVISRLEMTKLKNIVKFIDPTAFIVIQEVYEVDGVRFKKHK